MFCMSYKKLEDLFNLFAGKSEGMKLRQMYTLLSENGFKLEVKSFRGCTTYYYFNPDKVNIFALTSNSIGDELMLIIPREFSERHYMVDGEYKKIIRLNGHGGGNKEISAAIDIGDDANRKLHRVILEEAKIDIAGQDVDHKTGHPGINIPEELRPCTPQQNCANRKGYKTTLTGEFEYDPLHDFRDSFWIPFLHYVLGIISYEDMHTLRKMELGLI